MEKDIIGSIEEYPFIYWLERFNRSIESLTELDGKSTIKDKERTSISTLVGLEYFKDKNKDQKDLIEQNIEGLKNSLEKVEQEEKRKIEKNLYELENQKEVEKRIEKVLKQILSQIPNLGSLERNLNQMESDDFIQMNVEKMKKIN